ARALGGLYARRVGARRRGVLGEVLQVRVRRRAVAVEVILLAVLAVVPLGIGQREQAFLEDRILAVPQGESEAEVLFVVGDAGEAVLAPTIGPRPGLIVAEIVPGVAAFAVVLANGPPLPLAQVRSP